MIDQSASLLCQEGHAMLLDCGTLEIRQVPFRPADDGMVALVIDTRVPHALVSGQYAARRAECEEAARRLGISALRYITTPAWSPTARSLVDELTDPVLRRRARHVLTDSARVQAIADVLEAPAPMRFADIGNLLSAGHASLRDDFEVSWPEADVAVETALTAGALGAKMIGGGFGGSVLALVPAGKVAAVRSAIAAEFARNSWDSPEFLTAVPSPAARKIS
jgi:galactokinase